MKLYSFHYNIAKITCNMISSSFEEYTNVIFPIGKILETHFELQTQL